MSRPDALQTVIRVSEEREREATRLTVERRQQLESQEARMTELEDYRRQYLEQFHQAGSRGLGVGQLNEYRIFLSRLDQALQQQQQMVSRCRQSFEESRQHWLIRRQERRAVEKLAERRREEALRLALRREQKENDEFASRSRPNGVA